MDKEMLAQALARKQAVLRGDPERIAKQHAAGKQTARERIQQLLDDGSFVELDALLSCEQDYAGVITGSGTVDGRPVYLFAQDFTVHGGAMGQMHAQKVCKVLDLALKTGTPVIALCDSAGVRLDEGAKAMNAYARIYHRMARLSGVCPIIALVLGPAIGGAAMLVQLADISIQVNGIGQLSVYGPQVVSAVTGGAVDAKGFGGAEAMAQQGAVSFTASSESEAFALTAKLLSYLPDCCTDDVPLEDEDDLNRQLPDIAADDAAGLMEGICDAGSCFELFAAWGQEIRTALVRIGGYSVGLVASDAAVNNGELSPAACGKAARFIRFCDCFSLPVVSLVNSRGIQVPNAQGQRAAMNAASQLLFAYAEATVPKVSVIVGNALGQAYVAMGGETNADITYAWPGSVISALTPEAAVQVLYAEQLKQGIAREELEARFVSEVADGVVAARDGMVDDVIEPSQTRKYVIAALELLASKRDSNPPKKHGNMPL